MKFRSIAFPENKHLSFRWANGSVRKCSLFARKGVQIISSSGKLVEFNQKANLLVK